MSKNIIIDAGNSRYKHLCGSIVGEFASTYSTKFNPNGEYFERVEYKGKVVYIATGDYSREYTKVDKECIVEQILYAIGLNTSVVDVINLCLLLPINQMQKKDKLINTFKGNEFVFKINGKVREVRIEQCTVIPEGVATYYYLEDKSPYLTIIDIGFRTTNYAVFKDGKLVQNYTEPLGVFDLFSAIKNIENAKGNDFKEEEIELAIKNKVINPSNEIYLDFFKDILNRTKGIINLKLSKNYFTGGGAEILKSWIEQTPSIIVADTTYSNVLGAKKLCDKVWR